MKFKITVKQGLNTVAVLEGVYTVSKEYVTLAVIEKIIQTEQDLEFLTGLRFHIEEMK